MFEHRKTYEIELDGQLAQWDTEIGHLEAKVNSGEPDAQVRYGKTLGALQHQHRETSCRLQDLKNASDDAWESVKTLTEKSWLELKALFNSMAA